MTTNSPNPVDGDVQALIGLCKIEIKRWKAASEANPNMSYMVTLMETALAALTAEPVAYTDAEELETLRKGTFADMFTPHESYKADQLWIPLYTTPPAQLLRPVELPQRYRATLGKDCNDAEPRAVMLPARDGAWLSALDVEHCIRAAGYEVKS